MARTDVSRVWLFAFMISSLPYSQTSGNTCPTKCECTATTLSHHYSPASFLIDCRRQKLKEIPAHISCQATAFQMDYNYITSIKKVSFRPCHADLQKLIVNHNFVSYVEENAFKDLESLNRLELAYNLLTSLPYLGPLQNLYDIYLRQNLFKEWPLQRLGPVHLLGARFINLSNNRLRLPLRVSSDITHLQLEGNSISRLSDDMFEDPRVIRKLSGNSNDIEKVESLTSCVNLDYLNLNENKIRLVAYNAFTGHPKLKLLLMEKNRIVDISFIRRIPSLTKLFLRHNRISYIRNPALTELPKVLTIDLRQNELVRGMPNDVILPMVRNLLLNENQMRVFDKNILQNKTSVRILNLRGNRLNNNFSLVGIDMLEFLYAGHNKLKNVILSESGDSRLQFADFDHNFISNLARFRNLPFLTAVWFMDNLLSTWDPRALSDCPALHIVRLDGNWLREITNFTNIPSLERLDLSRNLIQSIKEFAFTGVPRLANLNLSSNKVANLSFLRDMTNLKELNLGQNLISVLTPEIFVGLVNLRTLSLSRNFIQTIDPMHLPVLNAIILSSNRISHLDVSVLSSSGLIQLIDLGNNNITHFVSRPITSSVNRQIIMDNNLLGSSNTSTIIGSHVVARYNKLVDIPKDTLNSKLVLLDLQGNKITRIGEQSFYATISLYFLNIMDNIIEYIDETAFSGLRNVYMIKLDRNRISRLLSGVFSSCTRLKFISLAGNPIHDVSNNLFVSPQGLSILDISNVPISEITTDTLRQISQTHYLDLESNTAVGKARHYADLTQIEFPNLSFLRLSQNHLQSNDCWGVHILADDLKVLDLASNDFTYFPSHCLSHVSKPYTLFLSRNKIRGIYANSFPIEQQFIELLFDHNDIHFLEEGSFRYQMNLMSLDLRDNRLTSLNPNFLAYSMKSLMIEYSGNPWKCDCEFIDLFEVFPSTWPSLRCSEPFPLSNSSLTNLHPTDLVCPPILCAESHETLIVMDGESGVEIPCPIIQARNISLRWSFSPIDNSSVSSIADDSEFHQHLYTRSNKSLFISHVTPEVAGTYTCSGLNGYWETVFIMDLVVVNRSDLTFITRNKFKMANSWKESLQCDGNKTMKQIDLNVKGMENTGSLEYPNFMCIVLNVLYVFTYLT